MTVHERQQPRATATRSCWPAAPAARRARGSAPTSCFQVYKYDEPIELTVAATAHEPVLATPALLEGSEAIADAMVAAGCRFFAGYPMTPFTEVLEHMAAKLPGVGGTCMNAESELEAVGMAWGAAATGTPARHRLHRPGAVAHAGVAGRALLARVPLVVLNMARGQGDYWQVDARRRPRRLPACRAGADGRPRGDRAGPAGVPRSRHVGATRCCSSATTTWPTPRPSVDGPAAADDRPRPADDWALDGSTGGTGQAKPDVAAGHDQAQRTTAATTSPRTTAACAEPRRGDAGRHRAPGRDRVHSTTPRSWWSPSARRPSTCGPPSPAARPRGAASGSSARSPCCPSRPTSSPAAAEGAGLVAVYENNQGQMVDDVRSPSLGRDTPVQFIGRPQPRRLGLRHRARPRRARYLRDRIQELLDEMDEKVDHA